MKSDVHDNLALQIGGLIESETDLIAGLSNVVAAIHHEMKNWWTGFYLVKTEENKELLVLGPFQGPVACTRIEKGKGVCGTSWKKEESIVVPNVHEFEGHIACSALSNSEIVIPVFKDKEVVAILDLDSKNFDQYSDQDKTQLEHICQMVSNLF